MGPVSRPVQRAREALETLKSTNSEQELISAWEDFLVYHRRALSKANDIASKSPKLASWSRELRGLYFGGDEGLQYLWEARNADDHGLQVPYSVEPSELNIGNGLISIEGCRNGTIESVQYNGRSIVEKLVISEGKVKTDFSLPNAYTFRRAEISLKEANSEAKRKSFQVPVSFLGASISQGDPIELAEHACRHLENVLVKIREVYPNG